MVITSLQLLQMVVGCVVNYTAFTFKTKGQSLSHPLENFLTFPGYIVLISGMSCGVSETNLRLSLLMYSSYFILFARFFYNTYFAQSQRKFCPVEKKLQCNQDNSHGELLREGSESESKVEQDKTEDEKD